MRRAQSVVVSAACLLTLLGLFFPLTFQPHELWGSEMPFPMWLFAALKHQHDERDPVTLAWFAIAAVLSLFNLCFDVIYAAMKEKIRMSMQTDPVLSRRPTGDKVLIALWLVPASCLVLAGIQSLREATQIAAAPRLKAAELTLAYRREPALTGRRYDHKFIVVTGPVNGMDAGLFGDGVLYMEGVHCDVGGEFGPCRGCGTCTVAGTCVGKDENGTILVSNGRVLP